ncbi:MAG: glycosyltransferase [Lachnospiraceae bacterium]|nr:glycosyltransferase [Lachnospiraceae bacterium]
MKFSIIVVSLNAGDKLKKTVESVLEQDYSDYEIIVKDGFSTDGSLDKLPQDSRIKIYKNRDLGIYDAMNQALSHISGEYVQFLNCGDSFYEKSILSKTAAIIDGLSREEKKKPHIFYGDTYNEYTGSLEVSPNAITDSGCYRNIPCHQSCIYDASLFKERKYDISFNVRADYEHFLYSVYRRNAVCRHMGFAVANYEGGGYSDSPKNREKREKERRIIIERYLSPEKIKKFDCLMILTLAPLRTKMNESRMFSRLYNAVKSVIYRIYKRLGV